ncbi:MAG TPA: hypothetical protein VL172_06560, partial [Kofleriaceae bacterium]|nr:hypothetical protein [Kofleriaceae bacterium]
MAFLYGDSTPSPLTFDYLEYLRAVFALAVELLLADERLLVQARRRQALDGRTAELGRRLEALRGTARAAVAEVARSPIDDAVTRCANHVEGAIDEVVMRSAAEVQSQRERAAAAIAAEEDAARAACLAAASTFLRSHDFPDAVAEIEVDHGDDHQDAMLRSVAPCGIAAEIELALADAQLAGAELRAGRDKLVLVRARRDPRRLELLMCTSRSTGSPGLAIAIDRTGAVSIEPAEGGAVARRPDADQALAAMAADVGAGLDALAGRRGAVHALTVDDGPIDDPDGPTLLVDRLFAAMAPQVRTIAERSVNPGELVLRRLLGDGHREEIFVAHSALAEVVAQLPLGRRHHFAILGIPGLDTARAPTG